MKTVSTFLVILVAAIAIAGCAGSGPKGDLTDKCPLPNKEIAGECCIDQNMNDLCDKDEPEVLPPGQEEVSEPLMDFAKTFASFWNRQDYKTLHQLFTFDYRDEMSDEQFAFLATQRHKIKAITKVEIEQVGSKEIKYKISTEDDTVLHVTAEVAQEGLDWKHLPFFYFENMDYASVCIDAGNNVKLKECGLSLNDRNKTGCIDDTRYQCFMNYAIISEDASMCDSAGYYKPDCLMRIGEFVPLKDRIDLCGRYTDDVERSDCLTEVAKEFKSGEPCAKLEFDQQRYSCYGFVAGAMNDVALCKEFVNSHGYYNNRYKEGLCILSFVETTGNRTACQLIEARDSSMIGSLKETCSRIGVGR
jgi:hypothetical protein